MTVKKIQGYLWTTSECEYIYSVLRLHFVLILDLLWKNEAPKDFLDLLRSKYYYRSFTIQKLIIFNCCLLYIPVDLCSKKENSLNDLFRLKSSFSLLPRYRSGGHRVVPLDCKYLTEMSLKTTSTIPLICIFIFVGAL